MSAIATCKVKDKGWAIQAEKDSWTLEKKVIKYKEIKKIKFNPAMSKSSKAICGYIILERKKKL